MAQDINRGGRQRMFDYIRGEHGYRVVQGEPDNPTRVLVVRLDKADLDEEEMDEVAEKLLIALRRDVYQTSRVAPTSGKEVSFSVTYKRAAMDRGAGVVTNGASAVSRDEIIALLARIPDVLY